jgi:hypothetical protein
MTYQAIVLDSPIEFVIVGPVEGRDRVLAKSRTAGLDLVGLAAEGPSKRSPPDLLSTLFVGTRQLNVLTSIPLPDVISGSDSRHSRFSFAWRSFATLSGIQAVKGVFDLQMRDLHRALKDRDVYEVEWVIAPIVLSCAKANERLLRRRRVILTTAAMYLGLAIFTFAATFLMILLRHFNLLN